MISNCYLSAVIKHWLIALFILLLHYSVKAPVYAEALAGRQGSTDKQDQRVIDSLKSLIETAEYACPGPCPGDTSICHAYITWGEQVYLSNPDTAMLLFHKVREIAEKNLDDSQFNGLPASGGQAGALEKKYILYLAEALNNIGYLYMNQGDIPKALDYHFKSLKMREEIGNSPDPRTTRAGKNGIAESLNNIALIYNKQGDIPKALEYFHKSLKIREELGNKEGIAIALNNIGSIYENQGDIPTALEYNHKSLKIYEQIGNSPDPSTARKGKEGIANSLNNIGFIYYNQDDLPSALEYFHESLKIMEEIGDKKGIATSLNNIGSIYNQQGDAFNALEYYRKSLKVYEGIGHKKGMTTALNNIGLIYDIKGDIQKALEYYKKSLKIRQEIGYKSGIAASLNKIGLIELRQASAPSFANASQGKKATAYRQTFAEATAYRQGALARALKNGNRGLLIAREIGSPHLISLHSGLLCKVAKKQAILTSDPAFRQAKYKEALEMYELHILMRDSIKNEETQKATIRQQTKYEFEKAQLIKEQEEKEKARLKAEVTNRRNNLQHSVILIAILVLFGGVLFMGFVNVSERMAEGIIFFSFLILFEFLLVLADPYIDRWSSGAPGIKLLFNAAIAALIFPAHAFFESKLKSRLVKK